MHKSIANSGFKKASVVLVAACALCVFVPPARADMSDIKISDARMVQTPNVRFILPTGSVELSVHQQVSSTTIDIASKYDMLNSFFHFGFDLRYNFAPYFAGGALGDTINFDQTYGAQTYFQRVHSATPYFGYKLGRYTEVKTGVSIGNTITASVDQNVAIDKGNVIVESAGITFDTTDAGNPVPNGAMIEATLYGSFRSLGSDYGYTKGEVDIKNTYMPFRVDYLESFFKFYFPLTTEVKPISDVYFAGGYEILRGYGYREFYGDTLKYAKVNYHIPIVRNVRTQMLRAAVQILTIDITGETVQIGNVMDFGNLYSLKSSVSFGFGCDVILFRHINLKFDTFAGKALEPRLPVLYFILTAYTYFSA